MVDPNNKKPSSFFTLASFIPLILTVGIGWVILKPLSAPLMITPGKYFLFLFSMIAYIVLHELVHGAAYKLLTHQKLTFGLTLTVAYCGVPDIFVYRRTAMISLLAPFVLFIPVFLIPVFLFQNPWDQLLVLVLLGLHLGGCVGDLYDTFLFLTRYRDPAILMNDTGPKQTFYGK